MIKASKIKQIQKIISLKVSSVVIEVNNSVFITKAVKTLNLFVAKSWFIESLIFFIRIYTRIKLYILYSVS
jgi:hypothetical protein